MIKKYICFFSFIIFLTFIGQAQADREPQTGKLMEKTVSTDVEFASSGVINRLEDNKIVIDDREFIIAPNVQFYSTTGETLLKKNFNKGDTAGYKLNMKKEIIFLYKIKGER
ncbi:hypothetical protein DRQ07_12215 [candidate division KSB1 bacterium]|nr:MAG: hypothetical protein DRQ07_12215 [candidate division KSB1 bacterium]